MKQYKAVPAPQVMELGRNDSIGKAFNGYSDVINREAAGGWSYHSTTTVTVSRKGGCLHKDSVSHLQLMIFEREN